MSKKTAFLSLLLLPLLSSCDFHLPFVTTSGEIPSFGYREPEYGVQDSSANLNVTNVGAWNGQVYMPHQGEARILVVPIAFADDSFSSLELERLQHSFFSPSSMTGWESVASYYEKSSYGNLMITGEVAPVLTLSATVAEAGTMDATTLTESILDESLSFYAPTMDLSSFDANGDGYLDAVWMVYSAPFRSSSDLFWAFTSWTSSQATYSGLRASSYSWASIDFLTEGNYAPAGSAYNGDAHTFIHETGHLLGLDDYYSYDVGESNLDSPTGGALMMDYNIGDHDAYSKYVLSWVDPVVVTEDLLERNDGTLTLSSFEETGDCLILPIVQDGVEDFNGTPFDEYLILEYYTPTGLNAQDARVPYQNQLSMFTEPGILVYHVNSRIGKLTPSYSAVMGLEWDGCSYDRIPLAQPRNELYYYIYSNTRSRCFDTRIEDEDSSYYRGRLLSLLPASGRKTRFEAWSMANNTSLYQQGDSFLLPGGTYEEFVFDDGSKPAYGFEIEQKGDESCRLHFQALE